MADVLTIHEYNILNKSKYKYIQAVYGLKHEEGELVCYIVGNTKADVKETSSTIFSEYKWISRAWVKF